jgi:tRNA A-37 threonylcarbamoyl transferase component Bud32
MIKKRSIHYNMGYPRRIGPNRFVWVVSDDTTPPPPQPTTKGKGKAAAPKKKKTSIKTNPEKSPKVTSKATKQRVKNMTNDEKKARCEAMGQMTNPTTGRCINPPKPKAPPKIPDSPNTPNLRLSPAGVHKNYRLRPWTRNPVHKNKRVKLGKHWWWSGDLGATADGVYLRNLAIKLDEGKRYATEMEPGAYGQTYIFTRDNANELLKLIKNARPDDYARFVKFVPAEVSHVVVKYQQRYPGDTMGNRVIQNELKTHETLQGLSHIPTLYGGSLVGSGYIIIMEYIKGRPLESIMQDPRGYDLDKIKKSLNTAMIQMWKRGVIHNDLHTKNILVTRNNKVYIIDFGLAHETNQILDAAKDFSENNDARRLWKKHLEKYGDSLADRMGHPWYNPNSKVLAYLQTL